MTVRSEKGDVELQSAGRRDCCMRETPVSGEDQTGGDGTATPQNSGDGQSATDNTLCVIKVSGTTEANQ